MLIGTEIKAFLGYFIVQMFTWILCIGEKARVYVQIRGTMELNH